MDHRLHLVVATEERRQTSQRIGGVLQQPRPGGFGVEGQAKLGGVELGRPGVGRHHDGLRGTVRQLGEDRVELVGLPIARVESGDRDIARRRRAGEDDVGSKDQTGNRDHHHEGPGAVARAVAGTHDRQP